ncbi:prepilin-type N-terminal cleavage/methylation domain-containing protein [Fibrobacter sp.]|uniref:type II secretion system protein n=1 Tax=Fibrobacter sp. TaxID=35828 RepID=UPI0026194EB4|nr:prepilin-type N-terminal cleavage/methylation domain-containing protein [Fibrobacter sp.]MDD5944049.1 prepilin-type N-terminal cleavage/methylation domain-containing protein [Fibrobacter sp.]
MIKKAIRCFSDMLSMNPVSVETAGSRVCSRKKAGFTIVELMVVIVIINLLAGVGVPKLTDLIERTRQNVDLMRLYHLRDALNRALYEGDVYATDGKVGSSGCKDVSKSNIDKYLSDAKGMLLFVVEQNGIWPANYQGAGKGAETNNMCGLMVAGGFGTVRFKTLVSVRLLISLMLEPMEMTSKTMESQLLSRKK